MPLQPVYVELEDFKSAVTIPDELTDDDATRAITAASRAIDQLTSRKFGKTDTEETRRFTAISKKLVVTSDIVSISSIENNGTTVAEDSYLSGPANADMDDRPFEWLEIIGDSPDLSRKPGAISITGIFGWPEVPIQIKQMTMIFASKLFKRTREAPWGIVTSGTVEGLSLRIVRDDPDAKLLTSGMTRAETYNG